MRPFGELEAAVMTVLWDRGEPTTVRDALASLRPTRDVAYTTVLTVMDNLHRKGQVEREMRGRAWLYRPVRTRIEHAAACLQGVLDEYEDRHEVLMRFVAELDSDSVAQLRTAVEAARGRSSLGADLVDRTSSRAS
ncbi:BlaI/MecI/CopY family transcriptional regulator [Modestobacter sp. VKM Ac-2979]|uniref:BlaI/MecI/CopY family transcriptional regulator n=1 Tax=unclassified Modestobacter TaxID=2643866 RepID=UPI0022AB72B9|nr:MULTISPECIES: BlaI/MecI/CopY family transcriptional regulator [unclassified Modestobacter]MCZ2813719.1 BlaI/MecI/CopY family transcriptional regulator [Modestobacter sp. VKM Ac-2979]MCZ2844306.1 BlaI/MecI/CopY family transcriptional regulator [Modestobacter sp. VKM Ac-2980]